MLGGVRYPVGPEGVAFWPVTDEMNLGGTQASHGGVYWPSW